MSGPVSAAYDALLAGGELKPDPAQAAAADALDRLAEPEGGLLSRLLRRDDDGPAGVYLWGGVGRGKSMLMDLFYETATGFKKRRTHFHVFMGEVHRLIDAWRKGDPAARKARFGQHKGDDPIPPVADVVAQEARLLAFDEFQVTNIADAMILARLFETLFDEGITVIATSNHTPDDLYKDGLQRDRVRFRIELRVPDRQSDLRVPP